MYSIVMLSALSAGADVTPAPAPVVVAAAPVAFGCGGGCHGSCTGAYYAAGCHGSCHGGVMKGGFLGRRGSCHGGGYSCSGYNCFGSGYGSCYGGCYGSYIAGFGSCHGCSGLFSYGSTWGPPIGMPPYTLHGYNSGLYPVYGPGHPVVPYTSPQAVYGSVTNPNRPPVMSVPVAPAPKSSSDKEPMKDAKDPMSANLKFELPAGAALFVDGKQVYPDAADKAAAPTFYTPALPAGQKFFYEVKAVLTVGGKPVAEEKRVVVEAGADLVVTFPQVAAAAGNAASVAGK